MKNHKKIFLSPKVTKKKLQSPPPLLPQISKFKVQNTFHTISDTHRKMSNLTNILPSPKITEKNSKSKSHPKKDNTTIRSLCYFVLVLCASLRYSGSFALVICTTLQSFALLCGPLRYYPVLCVLNEYHLKRPWLINIALPGHDACVLAEIGANGGGSWCCLQSISGV